MREKKKIAQRIKTLKRLGILAVLYSPTLVYFGNSVSHLYSYGDHLYVYCSGMQTSTTPSLPASKYTPITTHTAPTTAPAGRNVTAHVGATAVFFPRQAIP